MTDIAPGEFPRGTTGLSAGVAPALIELADGDAFELRVAPVAKRVGESTVRMLAYNGSVPGPILKVKQGSEIAVGVRNDGDLETTVHWHGLRVENRYDGTHETQAAIPVGGEFTYRVRFPDPGLYWYHPHVREDYGQELGLYGNIVVEPADPDYWSPVDRELVLTLDDVLIEDGLIAPFDRAGTNYVAMGRFGNVMLIGGETEPELTARPGELARLYLTNTANTRVFNVTVEGARMKLVGGDSGRYEHETFVDSVLLAPSERAIVDVLFIEPGRATLEHRHDGALYTLATIDVGGDAVEPPRESAFELRRTNADLVAERERIAPYLGAAPDKTLAFVAEMDMGGDGAHGYACPMHPHVVSDEPGRCPECGMKLLPVGVASGGGHAHEHAMENHHAMEHEHHHGEHSGSDGIEWEDDMVEVNRLTTPETMRWKLVDRDTGAENHAIDWSFAVGDQVKLRLLNELDSDHPMHHPFHIHGAGRFLVLARNGVTEPNLVWKDTVLVRTGETVDLLLDVVNPGRWMAHCHIAEHHEGGMMLSFTVTDPRAA